MKTKFLLLTLLASLALSFAAESEKRPPSPRDEKTTPPLSEKTTSELETDLKNAKARLTEMRVNYTDEHPLVRQQLRKIGELERELAKRK